MMRLEGAWDIAFQGQVADTTKPRRSYDGKSIGHFERLQNGLYCLSAISKMTRVVGGT